MSFEYFTYYIFAPLILCFGLLGNIAGLIVLSGKKMNQIGPRNMFQYLFYMDTVYLVQIVFNYMAFAYHITFASFSPFTCKLYFYMNDSLDPISSLLLVYLSVDRLISIIYSPKRDFLRKYKTQLIYFLLTIGFFLAIFSPVAIFATYNQEIIVNVTVHGCSINNKEIRDIMLIVDVVTRLVIPFSLMIFFSVWLSIAIFLSRKKIAASTTSTNSAKILKRDKKFAITSICLNLVYIILNIPITLVFSIDDLIQIEVLYEFSLYLFYVPYGINFYLLFISNSIFRKEFFRITGKIRKMTTSYNFRTSNTT